MIAKTRMTRPLTGLSLVRPTSTGSTIEMYVPMFGMNCAMRPVHSPSASQYGIPMIIMNVPCTVAEIVARMHRAAT